MKSKIFSIVLSVCLMGTAVPFNVSAKECVEPEANCGEATFIVSLDTPALIDFVNASDGRYKKVNEFLFTDEGRDVSSSLEKYREAVKNIIADAIPSADFSESRSFSVVANGFTVKADMSDYNTLKNLIGVKSADISGVTKIQNRTASKIISNTNDSGNKKLKASQAYLESINVQEAYDAGYTGKDMLIAIIDSEFDLKNQTFSAAPKNPAYTKNFVKRINSVSKFNISDNSIDDIFYNGKIIYAYDYGEDDTDCADDMIYHGTHVSGIAAGNSGGKGRFDYKGVAYDAQLALFKVADENLSLDDDAILAALDDSVKLGPDVINCSFGARKFLLYDYEGKSLFERLTISGINVVCAAGNDGVNGYSLGVQDIPADYITYGTVGTPSSEDGMFSVAASVPEKYYANKTRIIFNDVREFKAKATHIETDAAEEKKLMSVKKHSSDEEDEPEEDIISYEEYKYIFIDGTGTESELKDANIKGRMVVLNKGAQPIKDVIKKVQKYGGQGIIIIDNGSMEYSSSDDFSSVLVYVIDSSARDYLLKHPKGYYSIELMDTLELISDTRADEICEFSSVGVRADLTLKPDITAPGNNVLSAGYNNQYQMMSGTSMASPCTAGAVALVKQYVRKKELSKNMSAADEEELVYKLIMSTARLSEYNKSGSTSQRKLYYSPRSQGAGIVNAGGAVKTPAYLEVNGERPSISLKEIKNNTFTFDFTVVNISDKAVSYKPDIVLQTDGYKLKENENTHKMEYINTLEPVSINNKSAVSFSERNITVAPKSKKTVTVRVSLDKNFIESNMAVFKNGFFADGFVILNSDDSVQLSLPFTGFCGNWSSGPIFSKNVYDNSGNFPYYNGTLSAAMLIDGNEIVSRKLGVNSLGFDDLPSEISFSTGALKKYLYDNNNRYPSSVLLPDFFLLRDAADFTISLEDTGGNMVYYRNFGGIASNINSGFTQVKEFEQTVYEDMIRDYETVCESIFPNRYKYTLTASTIDSDGNPDRTESCSFDVRFDNTDPDMEVCYLEKNDEGKLLLHIEAFDDGYLQGIEFFALELDSRGYVTDKLNIMDDYKEYYKTDPVEYSYDKDSRIYSFVFDVTDYEKFINYCRNYSEVYEDDTVTIIFEKDDIYKKVSSHVFGVRALDYAYNTSDMKVFDVRNYGSCHLTFENENGSLAGGVTVSVNGEEYTTNSKGVIELTSLPLKYNYISLSNSGYEFTEGFLTTIFGLDEQEYHADKKYVLYKRKSFPVPKTSSADESSEVTEISEVSDTSISDVSQDVSTDPEKSVVSGSPVGYDTGDDKPLILIPVIILISAGVLIIASGKKKNT